MIKVIVHFKYLLHLLFLSAFINNEINGIYAINYSGIEVVALDFVPLNYNTNVANTVFYKHFYI